MGPTKGHPSPTPLAKGYLRGYKLFVDIKTSLPSKTQHLTAVRTYLVLPNGRDNIDMFF